MTIAAEFDVQVSDSQSDGKLLDEVAGSGSAECFEVLVERHSAMVLSVCQRHLFDSHDAEEAAQAVFLVLWKKAASLRHRQAVETWPRDTLLTSETLWDHDQRHCVDYILGGQRMRGGSACDICFNYHASRDVVRGRETHWRRSAFRPDCGARERSYEHVDDSET